MLKGGWAHLAGRIGVVGIYGADNLSVDRSRRRRGGRFASLYVDEVCFPARLGMQALDADALFLDAGWAVLSGVDEGSVGNLEYESFAEEDVRGIKLQGMDGRTYAVPVNFGGEATVFKLGILGGGCWRVVVDGERKEKEDVELKPHSVELLILDE